nr:MAG TPA: tail protein [Caudoviricetes sp.]
MGGSSKGGGGHTPYEAPDSLRSAQKLRAIGLISLGPIKGPANKWKDTYFDNTPIQNANGVDDNDAASFNFKNTEIQYNLGYQDQKPLEGFEASEREVSVGAEVKQQHPITRSVIDPDVTRLRLTIGVNALISQNDQGDTHGTSVDFQVLVNNTPRGTYQIEGKSSSRFYRSYIIDDLPPRPFTVTVKRLTADSKSQRLQNGTHWVSYTEIIDTKLSYPNMAIVGIKTDSRYNPNFPNINFLLYGRIIKIPTTYDPEARTYAPGLWRGDFKMGWTNNPAWIFYDLITDKLAGLGERIGDFGIDKFMLYEIAKYCDELVDDGYGGKEPRMVSNLWITEQRDAYNVISDMASVFRAIAVWDGTQFTAIQDRPTDPVCLYSQSNVVDGKFSRQYTAGKAIFTAVEVEYADERNLYQKAIEYVADDGMIARYGYNVKKMTAYGCTSRGQAHRYGKWVLETSRLEQCSITFTVGRQGLMHLPGDIIEVADNNYAGKVLGGRVVAINGKKVTLDQPVEIKGESYLNYITTDGLTKIKIKSVDKSNPAIVELDSVPQGLAVFDNWVLKSGVVSTQLYRALGITENDDGSYTITALQHEPQKEAIVDVSASFMPSVTTSHGAGVNKPANADISFGDGGVKLTWTTPTSHGAIKYDIKLYRNGNLYSTHLDLDSPEISFDNLPSGSYTVEIRGKNGLGQLSDPVTRTFEINLNIPRFVTKSLLFAIELDWDLPKTATIGNYTEVWRSTTNDISKAVKVATLPYPQNNYVMSGVPLSAEYYFWLRCGDKNDNKGEFTAAVFGEADHNPESLLKMVEDTVTRVGVGQELIKSLKNDINSANNAVSEETKARIAAVNNAIQQINNQAAATGTAIQKLEKADKAQAETIKTVTAKAESALSGITAEQKARADGDRVEAQARQALAGRVANAESGIASLRETVNQKDSARATEIRNLSAKVDGVSVGGRNYALLTGLQDKILTVNGSNQTKTVNVDVSPALSLTQGDSLIISCDIDLSNATSIYGKPYPRIGAELSVVYDDNSVGYFSAWYDEAVNGVKKTLKQRISAQHTIPKAVKSIRNIIVQARYQTSDYIKVSNVKLERGTVATDWSPAPEDGSTEIARVSADLTNYQQAQATTNNAQSQKLGELTARVGAAEGSIANIRTAKADKSEVASIAQQSLRATWQADAQAKADKAKTDAVAQSKAEIDVVSRTVAGVNNKLSSTHTIKTQVVGGGRTAIAGIALGASSDGRTAESSVIVMADKFGVVKNATDGTVQNVFTLANGRLALSGDLIADGTILGQHIRANQSLNSPIINGGSLNIGDGRFAVNNQGQVSIRANPNNNVGLYINNETIIVYDDRGMIRVKIGRLS